MPSLTHSHTPSLSLWFSVCLSASLSLSQPLGKIPWALAEGAMLLDRTVLTVTDDEIRSAMRVSLLEMKQV